MWLLTMLLPWLPPLVLRTCPKRRSKSSSCSRSQTWRRGRLPNAFHTICGRRPWLGGGQESCGRALRQLLLQRTRIHLCAYSPPAGVPPLRAACKCSRHRRSNMWRLSRCLLLRRAPLPRPRLPEAGSGISRSVCGRRHLGPRGLWQTKTLRRCSCLCQPRQQRLGPTVKSCHPRPFAILIRISSSGGLVAAEPPRSRSCRHSSSYAATEVASVLPPRTAAPHRGQMRVALPLLWPPQPRGGGRSRDLKRTHRRRLVGLLVAACGPTRSRSGC